MTLDPKKVRENIEISYRICNVGNTDETVKEAVDKMMAVWLKENISLLNSTEFSFDDFTREDLTVMMNAFAEPSVENFRASAVIKTYLESVYTKSYLLNNICLN